MSAPQVTVGYHGSEAAKEAVRWAAEEAAVRKWRLRIVSCYELPLAGESVLGWSATAALDSLLDATEALLREARAMVAASHPDVDVTAEALPGPASLVLVERLAPTDLLVVGASTAGALVSALLGGLIHHVLRHSPCPVAVVHGVASRGRPDRVVVGVDGSAVSDAALAWAADEAERHAVELHVVHCWAAPIWLERTERATAHDVGMVDAATLVEQSVAHARELCLSEVSGELVEDAPVPGLLRSVRDGDVVVLGSVGLGALAAHVLGSTVDGMIRSCAAPVVVVRPRDER